MRELLIAALALVAGALITLVMVTLLKKPEAAEATISTEPPRPPPSTKPAAPTEISPALLQSLSVPTQVLRGDAVVNASERLDAFVERVPTPSCCGLVAGGRAVLPYEQAKDVAKAAATGPPSEADVPHVRQGDARGQEKLATARAGAEGG